MVNILYWNVRNFSNIKIAQAAPSPSAAYGAPAQGPARLTWMLNTMSSGTLLGAPFVPDFIVVVEVERGAMNIGPGYPIGGNAATGVNNLLNAINANPTLNVGGARAWHLVPPLSLGKRGLAEGVAVFYNSIDWYFIGPIARAATYAAPFAAALPVRVVPVARRFGQRVAQENRMQGQWHFTSRRRVRYGTPSTVKFPFRNSRPPWLTYFSAVGGGPTLLRLMAIHTSPASADAGTRAIRNIGTMLGAYDEAQQIDIILGDFNVDGVAPATWAAGGPYAYLVGNEPAGNANPAYAAAVRPPVGLNAQYNSYYRTHSPNALGNCIVETVASFPAGFPPGYRYLNDSLDNIFYRTNIGGVPANANATIINRATGTPYAAAAGPGPPVPAPYQGTVTYAHNMNMAMATIVAHIGPGTMIDPNAELQEWDNFGRMHSTSDHLPIVVQI